ncbi:MAG: PepSY-associated TM helix domain-containing protein [Opitutaceae bacterium]|nr:PepSY-associated TM helix domain-containing protein [Opitutaceae bacterium]
MRQSFYVFVRGLHLYVGLFLSPFVLVFAISVIFLVHSWVPGSGAPAASRNATNLSIPSDFERLKGREQVAAAHALLDQIPVRGEIGFVRQFPKERRFVIPVSVPGSETVVELNVESRSAKISSRTTGVADAMVFLHKMPGPHNVNVRGNSAFMTVWRWLADATVYLLLFLSMSGIYLWVVLKNERRVGIVMLAAGALSFGGLVYALVA